MISNAINKIVANIILAMIYAGILTHPDQLKGDVDVTELKYMSGASEIENGNETGKYQDDVRRLLLTDSVIMNRINSSKWKGNNVEEVILARGQYAPVTRNNFKTKKADDITVLCAKYVLIFGPICPENVVYQGQCKNGSGIYDSIPVKGDKDELFCFE